MFQSSIEFFEVRQREQLRFLKPRQVRSRREKGIAGCADGGVKRKEAEGYKSRVVNESEGEAARFVSVYEEYVKAKDVTRKKLH